MKEQNIAFQPDQWSAASTLRQSYLSLLVEHEIARNPNRQRIGTEQFADRFGLEGFNFKLAGMVADSFGRVFTGGVFSSMRQSLADLFAPSRTRAVLPPLQSGFRLWMSRQNYISLSEVTVYIPKGLRVSYLDYLDALEKAAPTVLGILDGIIEPTIGYISTLINNPSYIRSASGIGVNGVKATLANVKVEDVAEGIASCFDPSGNTDEAKYGAVVQRNRDFDEVHRRLTALQETVAASRPVEVGKRVDQLIDLCEKLADAVREHPEYKSISEAIGKETASRIYACAQWAEFYAVYLRQVMVLEAAIDDTVKKLTKISKN